MFVLAYAAEHRMWNLQSLLEDDPWRKSRPLRCRNSPPKRSLNDLMEIHKVSYDPSPESIPHTL